MSEASFIYPPNGNFSDVSSFGHINLYDSVVIVYQSTWAELNLTFLCKPVLTSDVYIYSNIEGNPILPNGTLQIGQISKLGLQIYQYPTQCFLRLTQYQNDSNTVDGEDFDLVSEEITSTTYRPAPTVAIGFTSLIQTATANASGAITISAAASASTAISQPSSTSKGVLEQSSASGLSSGAAAGIGVGVALGIIAIVVMSFVVFRWHRQAREGIYYSAAAQQKKQELPAFTVEQRQEQENQTLGSSRHELSGSSKQVQPSELP